MDIVNWDLVKHPINWIIVLLMVFIAGIALHLILQYMQGPAPKKTA